MKVYFAGSIRGGRSDAALYHRIIEYIKKTAPVLTEHVGNMDLQEMTTPEEIYAQDMAWLRESDVLIAECTNPSLGVGYELAAGEKLGKPCHIFYDRNRTVLSAMLSGDPYFILHPYEKEEEIYPQIDEILASLR
ncbi:MAG: nucleoside 2-deoxyribosyltransferase [Firmicutes bacterium]|nr:nucleoside 2-deoxyribosyltransferase [Bacillota bacterium]